MFFFSLAPSYGERNAVHNIYLYTSGKESNGGPEKKKQFVEPNMYADVAMMAPHIFRNKWS